jgi:hypothetical protein
MLFEVAHDLAELSDAKYLTPTNGVEWLSHVIFRYVLKRKARVELFHGAGFRRIPLFKIKYRYEQNSCFEW